MNSDIIKNKDLLTATTSRAQALEIVEAGIRRVLPKNIMASSVAFDIRTDVLTIQGRSFEVAGRRTFVVGGGKASGEMARLLEDIIGPKRITAGIVTTKYGDASSGAQRIEIVPAGHPVPDEKGVEAVRRMLDLKEAFSMGQNDLVLCLLSGGGSALMPCPVDAITLEEKQRVTGLLLSSGADISEVNCVRKHLSKTKGGQLGRWFAPATVVSIILSDVIGNDLSVIASGPTYLDPSTFSQALSVLDRYGIADSVPRSVLQYLESGRAGAVAETPKNLANCHNFIIGDIKLALEAMSSKATELGLHPFVITGEQSGETSEAAHVRAREIKDGKYPGFDIVMLGGETTPRLPVDHGKGGRNQHYAAVSLLEMKGYSSPWTVASVGTDGSDFLPEVAGAIVDESTLPRLSARGIDVSAWVDRYDSYGLFVQTADSLISTGNTGTNVGDVVVYVLK